MVALYQPGETIYIGRPRLGVRLAGGGGFVGAYDAIPSVAAAYGMRRLRSAYTGNLLRLRRSSDNAESDFGYTSTGALDTAAIATFVGGGSGFVVTWYDQSGNGSNATQSTAVNQPQYNASYLIFDGTDDYLTTGLTMPTNGSTVGKFSNQSGVAMLWGATDFASNYQVYNRSDTNNIFYYSGASTIGGITPYLVAGVLGMSATKAYRNGVAETGTLTFGAPALALFIGARNAAGTPGSYLNGRFHEFIISSTSYDATQMASIATIMG